MAKDTSVEEGVINQDASMASHYSETRIKNAVEDIDPNDQDAMICAIGKVLSKAEIEPAFQTNKAEILKQVQAAYPYFTPDQYEMITAKKEIKAGLTKYFNAVIAHEKDLSALKPIAPKTYEALSDVYDKIDHALGEIYEALHTEDIKKAGLEFDAANEIYDGVAHKASSAIMKNRFAELSEIFVQEAIGADVETQQKIADEIGVDMKHILTLEAA